MSSAGSLNVRTRPLPGRGHRGAVWPGHGRTALVDGLRVGHVARRTIQLLALSVFGGMFLG